MKMKLYPKLYVILKTIGLSLPVLINAQDSADDEDILIMSPFIVQTQNDRGYGATESLGATRTALKNIDISSNIVAITNEFMSDVGASSAQEALQYLSGIQTSVGDPNPGQAAVTIRGYTQRFGGFRDGLPDDAGTRDQLADDTAHYDRIEVIKGPAGVLYGSHNLGGVINKISKWAISDNFTNIELQAAAGFEEYIRGVIDTNKKLGENSAIRAVVSSRQGNRHWDDSEDGEAPANINAITLMGQTNFKNGGRLWGRYHYTFFELDREYNNQFLTGWQIGLREGERPLVDPDDSDFIHDKSLNKTPGDDISEGNIYNYELGFEKPFVMFDSDWTLRLVGRHSLAKGDKSPSIIQAGRPTAFDAAGNALGDTRTVRASDPNVADWRIQYQSRDFRSKRFDFSLNIDLAGEFDTWIAKHDMVINARVGLGERGNSFFRKIPPGTFSLVDGVVENLTNEELTAGVANTFIPWQGWRRSETASVGILDNISFMDEKLIFAFGSRYDYGRGINGTYDVAESLEKNNPVRIEDPTQSSDGNDFTWKYGVVYKPIEELSLFAQHATTFEFVTGVDVRTGLAFENQEGTIDEFGIKTALFDNRLIITASIFEMELTNVQIQVVRPDGSGFDLAQEGVQKTDGYEIDLAYLVNDNISLVFAASDVDSKNAADNFFRGVPINFNWSFFGRYTFTEGALEGAFAGLGYRQMGDYSIDNGNNLFGKGANIMDLVFGYRRDNWSAQVNVYNALSYDGMVSAISDFAIIRAEDPNFRVTVSYGF